jgi:hypothetical protein
MRLSAFVIAFVLSGFPAMAAPSTPAQKPVFHSLEATANWVSNYPRHRDIKHAPTAIRALSAHGAFRDADSAGTYVGFIAGLVGSNPDKAEALIEGMLPVAPSDEWVIVRGIAYSGAPQWKELLRKYSDRLATRQTMIAEYLAGRLPTLGMLAITPSPTMWQRVRETFSFGDGKKKDAPPILEPSQTVLDTLWGYYLASGSYGPLLRIVEFLPWSKDRDDVERLTIGSMAKYTLAVNALRDRDLLAKLKFIRNAKSQTQDMVALLDETIKAAETAETGALRKSALAAIEQLKTKGPGYKRDASTWAKVGQGALAVGCVTAAVMGQVYLGLPCVIGGGATSAAMYYMNQN